MYCLIINKAPQEQKLDTHLPRFLYPNTQERKAILILDQGSSIPVLLIILHSPLGTSISQAETSLIWPGSMQPYLLKVCFVSTVAIDNPYLQNIIFTSVLISGFCWNQRAGRDLGEPYSLLSANRSSLLYLSRTLVQ